MEAESFSAVIVGAGQAGGRAAKAMREAEFKGSITLIGSEPCLPYERPPLSKDFLQAPGVTASWIFEPGYADQHGIRLRLGRSAAAIDRTRCRVILDDGHEVAYDGLLLATGARVRVLEIPGFPSEDLYYLRTIEDAQRLECRLEAGRRLVIVGAGFIGLEVAASARARGCDIVVLESADRVLPRLGSAEASDYVLRHHLNSGVQIRLRTRIIAASNGHHLQLSDGSSINADMVVAGIGITPNTEIAAAAGLTTDDGLVTDEYGQTSDPHIFGAGDVTRQWNSALRRRVRLESYQNANLQAEAAARTLVGLPTTRPEPPWVWSDQGALNIQVAGVPAEIDQIVVRRDEADNSATVLQFFRAALVGGITLNRGKEMALIRRILSDPSAALDPGLAADPATPLRRAIQSKAHA